MENIVNFLIENYLWIMAVLIIGIITAIGFLADVRNKNKKTRKEKIQPEQEPIVENQMVNEAPINNQVSQAQVNLANSQVMMETPMVGQGVNPVEQPLGFENQNIAVQTIQNVVPQAEPTMINPTATPIFNQTTNTYNQPIETVNPVPQNALNVNNSASMPDFNANQFNSVVEPITPVMNVQPEIQPSFNQPKVEVPTQVNLANSQVMMETPMVNQGVNPVGQTLNFGNQNIPVQPVANQSIYGQVQQNVNPMTMNQQPSLDTQAQNDSANNDNQFWKL